MGYKGYRVIRGYKGIGKLGIGYYFEIQHSTFGVRTVKKSSPAFEGISGFGCTLAAD
jgi:hypothetical protein